MIYWAIRRKFENEEVKEFLDDVEGPEITLARDSGVVKDDKSTEQAINSNKIL